jgi:hypothetical protein
MVQLPYWYYSPSAKPGTIPMKVPFAEADLASHVLWMCPNMWQDQFNLHKKGMTPVDSMHLLLLSLKTILSMYVPKKDPMHIPVRRLLTRARKETRGQVPSLGARFPR